MTDHPPLRTSVPPARMRTPADDVRVRIDNGRVVLTFLGEVHTEVWIDPEVANQMIDDVAGLSEPARQIGVAEMTPNEMADELRKLGWSVAPPLTMETCKHPRITGYVWMGTNGKRAYGNCPDCGYFYDNVTPPERPCAAGRGAEQ